VDLGGDATGSWLVQLRIAGTPIGQVESAGVPVAAIGESLARSITSAHADRALRLAVAAWITGAPRAAAFTVDRAFGLVLEMVQERAQEQAQSLTGLTIALCSRDRPEQLSRALSAIAPNLRPCDELLVVLNATERDAASSIDQRHFPRARFVVEPRPGLGWARNRALVEYRSDVILFTDDDCIPDAAWLDAHRSLFARNPDIDVATGLIEPLVLETPAQRLFEQYGGFARHYLRRWIHAPHTASIASAVGNVGEYGAGANLAFRRRLVDRIGAFDVALGPGTASGAGDDLEFLFRSLKHGGLLAIEPRAVVRHEHRRTMPDLESQIEGWSRGFSCAIASATRTFPEERHAYLLLRARIAALYHARRAVFAPRVRRLALAELSGLRGAARRYARARDEASEIARRIVSPALDASSIGLRAADAAGARRSAHTARHASGRATEVTMELAEIHAAIVVGDDIDAVSVSIPHEGRQPTVVSVPVRNGVVGHDRLIDAVIADAGSAIIRGDWQDAVRSTHRLLTDAARALT